MTEPLSSKRVWIASNGTKKSLRLAEADGWEVHEVVKAPLCRPNSPEDIRQSMDLLQQIHQESLSSKPLVQLLTDYMMHLDDTEQCQAADLVRDAINEIEQLRAGLERIGDCDCDMYAVGSWPKHCDPPCRTCIANDALIAHLAREALRDADETSKPLPGGTPIKEYIAALDHERFVWWFSDAHGTEKVAFLTEYMRGLQERWTLDQWRVSIDKAMNAENGDGGI